MGWGEIEGVVVISGWESWKDGFLFCLFCCFFYLSDKRFVFVWTICFFLFGGSCLFVGRLCFCLFFFLLYLKGGVIYSLGIFFSRRTLFSCLLSRLFFLCFPILSGFSQHLLPSLTGRFNRTSWVTGPQGLGGLGVVWLLGFVGRVVVIGIGGGWRKSVRDRGGCRGDE